MSFSVGRDGQTSVPALHELKNQLQTSDLRKKAEIMECLLTNYRSDQAIEGALMPVIRYVSGYSKDHTLAKLTNLFWECLPSQDSSLTLLISQIIRNELLSTNEYMRGACLRNLAKTCNLEILKTVIDVIVDNLCHPHCYVRRNACLCIGAVAQRFPGHFDEALACLILLAREDDDPSTQQHAIHAVGVLNMKQAYQTFILDGAATRCVVPNPDVYNCGIIELIRSCWEKTKAFPPPVDLVEIVSRDALVAELMTILESTSSNEVRLSAITCLLWMSSREEHMKRAAHACVAIMTTHTSLDVKYHVLQIVEKIGAEHPNIIESVALDILRLLSADLPGGVCAITPDLAQQIIKLTIPSITAAQVKPAVQILQNHLLIRGKKDQVQTLVLKGMRQLCARFPSVAVSVIDVLVDYLSECESIEVISLLRELIVCSAIDQAIREGIVRRLIESIMDVRMADVLCQGIYLIGQFAQTAATKRQFVETLYKALEPLPLPPASGTTDEALQTTTNAKIVVKTVVLADGSYGTQNVLVDEEEKTYGIRECIIHSESTNLLSIICLAVCKVMLRKSNRETDDKALYHRAVLIVASLYKFAKENPTLGEGNCTRRRIEKSLRVLCDCYKADKRVSGTDGGDALLDAVVGQREITDGEEKNKEAAAAALCHVDDEINFFPSYDGLPSLAPALSKMSSVQGLKRVSENKIFSTVEGISLSGMSDPIYVEAYVRMNHLDVIIELLLVNRLPETLTNVSVNIGTHGDSMRILESSPESITLTGNGGTGTISSTIRLSSTDAGLVFGFCTFTKSVEKNHFPLSELQIDLLDCLEESYVGSSSFRRLWSEFEWENKIPISLTLARVDSEEEAAHLSRKCLQFIKLLLEKTKMKITAENESILSDKDLQTMSENGILAINFCTRSIFDEDALVNLSLDLQRPNKIAGSARIRSRTQGIALSLGDRVAQTQRAFAAL